MKTIVVISHFHRKIGPIVFYSYPKNSLDNDLLVKIANIMDQLFTESFFTHPFENLRSLNYYFEIPSDWGRGNKEMLMSSIIINQQISPEIEESIASLCRKFAEMMQSNEDIYTGLYINEISNHDDADKERIKKNKQLIKDEVKDLYWEIVEETRKESEEQIKSKNSTRIMKWEDTLNILIELLKQKSGLKAARIVSTEGIPIASALPEGVNETKIAISGPLVFYSYPKNSLDKDLSVKIANIMDQQFNEGFFSHSFENLKSMNYYFEITSDLTHGNQEMLMVSTVFNHQIKPEIEEKISDLCIEFTERLQSNEEIYTAFYINDLNYHENERWTILMNETLVKAWLNNLYWAIIEVTREKTEEEKIAILMNDRHIFETLERLSKGPIPFKWLRGWFFENFPNKNFKEIIDILVYKQFIFINQIGLEEKYVHLLKKVNAERIPPDSEMVYIDDKPELIDLLLPKVQDYYREYEKKSDEELKEDTFTLFQIMADPKKYNVLSQLRKGLILKDKLPKLVPKKSLDSLMEAIEFLKKYDVIEELNYNNETYIVLKTNLQITTVLPDWIVKSLRIDPETAVSAVMHSNPNIDAAIVIKGKQILYTTGNWDISGDVNKFLSSWIGQNARFIMRSGVKYSMLQTEAERLVAMFPEGIEGIVAIKGDEYILIIHYKI